MVQALGPPDVGLSASFSSVERSGPWAAYEWLVVVGAIMAFAMAWGIGANDVANSFGTTVGAKTITLWQACIIAAVFEFAGAVALGGEVIKTVAGSITDPASFRQYPEVFAYGMLCSLISAWVWVALATYLEFAVSSTHSIIGAVIGFGLVFGGGGAIVWNESTSQFPYRTGVVTVVISWFASPICASIASAVLFLLNRTLVLRRSNSTVLAFWALPPLVFITVFINVFFVLYKGANDELNWGENKAAWVAAIISGGCTLLSIPAIFVLKRIHTRDEAEAAARASDTYVQDIELELSKEYGQPSPTRTGISGVLDRVKKRLIYSLTVDVHEDVHKDEAVANMHQSAEVFDPKTEQVYKYLQVFSACCVSFAHGSNDVGNAVGPFAGIWYTYHNYNVAATAATPKWILVLGGAGIVAGLATYGYNIIKVLGVKMAKMTPSRGYCAELATALTVSVASVYGLPVSTTHCIVGAEVGVGIVEGMRHGTNWILFLKTFAAWIFTLVFAGLVSASIFSFGVYAPSLTGLDTVILYQDTFNAIIQNQMKILNSTNQRNQMLGLFDPAVDAAVRNLIQQSRRLQDYKENGAANMYSQADLAVLAANLFTGYTLPVVGYNKTSARFTPASISVLANTTSKH